MRIFNKKSMNLLLVFIGGGIGSLLRYIIGLLFQRSTGSLPLATFVANVIACLLFAAILWIAQLKGWTGVQFKLLLLTGFCGGLSTFSAFSYESFLLFRQGMAVYAFLNIFLSIGCCLLIFYIFGIRNAGQA